MERTIKSADCTTGYRKTLTRRFRGVILDDQERVIWTAKQRHRTAKEAKEFAARVLSTTTILTIKESENDKQDSE